MTVNSKIADIKTVEDKIANRLITINTNLVDKTDELIKAVKDTTVVSSILQQVTTINSTLKSALSSNGKWFISVFSSKMDELIKAVKNIKSDLVDNSDRTKSEDEEENASLLDLVTMIMYSIFILGSLVDLFLLLFEYVALMFQIPAVPALMNENVLLGWNYANAICIPGTEFSIINFLRVLVYITVIFSVIKVIRKAINNGSIGVI